MVFRLNSSTSKYDRLYDHNAGDTGTMKEIKFRQWIDHNRKFKYSGMDSICKNVFTSPFNFDVYPLEQYTGLKDKNGKEIFEGDILVFKIYDFNRNRNGWTVRGQVEFACGQFVAFNLEGLCEVLAHGTSHMEVIGNIHENPELLEADK